MYIRTSAQPALQLGFGNYTCNWGVHIAGLYETEEERDDILFGYLQQGCLDKDLCLYCPVERSPEMFIRQFTSACPDCGDAVNNPEDFSLMSARELYYPEGVFSVQAMDVGLNAFYQESQKNGKRNVRATADMVWAVETIPGVEHLMAYESRLNYFIPGKPWISICLYNTTRFDGRTIMQVLRTHPYTISGGTLMENPYFQNPDNWLARNAPQFLPENI